MYSLILSILVGILVGLIVSLTTGYYAFGVFIGFIFAVGLFIYFTRKFSMKLQQLFARANAEIQKQKMNIAIDMLKEGYRYKNWAFLAKAQIDSQIGVILYTQKKFGEAYKYLQKSNPRIYVAYAMLAIGHFKNNKKKESIEALKLLIKFNKKVAFTYAVAAHIHEEHFKDRETAISIIQKGLKQMPNNQLLKDHLLALQNNKKFKMEKHGEVWYQMMLEKKGLSRLQNKMMRQQQKKMKTKVLHR